MLNIKEKEYCNYHPSLTGKGFSIAVLEFNAMPNRQLLNILNLKVSLQMFDTS